VAGARVSFYRNDMQRGSLDLLADGRTDADGRFAFRSVPWIESHDWGFNTVIAIATHGQQVGMRELRWSRVELTKLEIELLPTITVRGTVQSAPDHKPIANVRVWPYIFGDVRGDARPLAWITAPLPPWHVATDAEGRFTLTGIPGVEKLHLHCEHDDFAISMAELDDLTQPVTLELVPGGKISGSVFLPSGEPAARALVRAAGKGAGYGWTVCDEQGKFCLRSLVADLYKVWAEAPDLTVVAADGLEVQPGKPIADVKVQLVRGGFVCGTILDRKTGLPIKPEEGVDVAMYGPARPRGGACESTPVRADGTFKIRAPAGKNLIYLRAEPFYEEKSETVEVEEGKETKVVWKVAATR